MSAASKPGPVPPKRWRPFL